MTTTTTKTIESLQTKQITPEGVTGEGTGVGLEAAALPVPSPRGRAQRSGEMGIIGRDGRQFRPRGEGRIHPLGSGGGRPPTMVGLPQAGAWRTGPQTLYATTPRGGTPAQIWVPGDDGC